MTTDNKEWEADYRGFYSKEGGFIVLPSGASIRLKDSNALNFVIDAHNADIKQLRDALDSERAKVAGLENAINIFQAQDPISCAKEHWKNYQPMERYTWVDVLYQFAMGIGIASGLFFWFFLWYLLARR